jgi:hypothetical protein
VPAVKVVRGRYGARLEDGEDLVSLVLAAPGPTHELFDVLAAAVVALAPGPRVILLGFAAGGMLGPLRAMGWAQSVDAVDRSNQGLALFRELCGGWALPLNFHRAEACSWLHRRRARYDVILDDLSVSTAHGHLKPPESLGALPRLIQRRLRPGGLAVINVFPGPGEVWCETLAAVTAPWGQALLVGGEAFSNRLVLACEALPSARAAGRRLRAALRSIGSRQAGQISVRSWPASAPA